MNNSPKQVFKGGWEELANAVHTSNKGTITIVNFSKDIFIKPDGTMLFATRDNVVEAYTMSRPYDVSTISGVIATFTITEDSDPHGIAFAPDGTSMIIAGRTTKTLYQYFFLIPWDITTTVPLVTTMSLSTLSVFVGQCEFSRDGDFVFVNDNTTIHSFPLPLTFDIVSNVTTTTFTPSGFPSLLSFSFKPEGDKMYIYDEGDTLLSEYNLPTINDITTAVLTGKSINLQTALNVLSPTLFTFFRSNGNELFVLDENLSDIYKMHSQERWDIPNLSYFSNIEPIPVAFADVKAVNWKPDGTKYYIADKTGNVSNIIEFTTLHPHNQTGAVQTAIFEITDENRITGMWWRPDGTRVYTIGLSDRVRQINVPIPWDVSSMVNPTISVAPGGLGLPNGIFFKTVNGVETRMYISGNANPDFVKQFDLTTPGNIQGGLTLSGTLDVDLTATNPMDLVFKLDGKQLYVITPVMDIVVRFVLSIPWDVTSTTLPADSLDISAEEIGGSGLFIRQHDGKKLYIVGVGADSVISYDMSINLVP